MSDDSELEDDERDPNWFDSEPYGDQVANARSAAITPS